MKKYFLISFVFLCSCTITKDNFHKGARLIEAESLNKIIKPKEVLFEFKANTPHLIYHYLDLSENLKKNFLKYNIKVFFNYDMNITATSFKEDIKMIPKMKYNRSKFQTIVNIEAKFPSQPSFQKASLNRPSKTYHQMSYEVSQEGIKCFKGLIDIMAYNTIVTQNDKVSKIIVDSILEN